MCIIPTEGEPAPPVVLRRRATGIDYIQEGIIHLFVQLADVLRLNSAGHSTISRAMPRVAAVKNYGDVVSLALR